MVVVADGTKEAAARLERVLTKDEHGVTWMHTGDVVRVDDDGFFHVADRKKDMIIRSGLKVYPLKVESALKDHPEPGARAGATSVTGLSSTCPLRCHLSSGRPWIGCRRS